MKYLIKGLVILSCVIISGCGCSNDGTCYQGVYKRKGINSKYATYLWIGEIKGQQAVYRFEKSMNYHMSSGKASYTKNKKKGQTVSFKLQFPYNKSMDDGHRLKWNGTWKCSGCDKITMPNGQEYLRDDKDWGNLNWEAFFRKH